MSLPGASAPSGATPSNQAGYLRVAENRGRRNHRQSDDLPDNIYNELYKGGKDCVKRGKTVSECDDDAVAVARIAPYSRFDQDLAASAYIDGAEEEAAKKPSLRLQPKK